MADTNVVTENPPTVAGIVTGVVTTTAGLIAGFNAGAFDAYDAWIVAAGLVFGALAGKVAQRYTTRWFPT